MLGAFRDFECALCVIHGGIKMAAFDEGHHQPRPLDHGRNRKLVEAVATGNIGVEFETLLEQHDRLPIFPERVIALPKTVEYSPSTSRSPCSRARRMAVSANSMARRCSPIRKW